MSFLITKIYCFVWRVAPPSSTVPPRSSASSFRFSCRFVLKAPSNSYQTLAFKRRNATALAPRPGDSKDANKDTDKDGVDDGIDAFPRNSHESVDTDHDGVGACLWPTIIAS